MHAATSHTTDEHGMSAAVCGNITRRVECSNVPNDVDCIPCLRRIAEAAVFPVATDDWRELLRKYRLALAIVGSTDFRHAIEEDTRELRQRLGVPEWDGRI